MKFVNLIILILGFIYAYEAKTVSAQWAFIAQNGMEKAPKSTVFSTIFNNGNLYMTIRQPRIHF